MNKIVRLSLIAAITFALAACGDDKSADYNHMGGDQGGGLPSDQVGLNGNDASSGIPPTRLPNGVNPDSADYSTLASDTVYFDFDKSTIPAGERSKLEAVATWFKANPGHALLLAGHADKRGTPEYNRALGERRAEAVRQYLVGLGLPASDLPTNSYGSDRPAVDGDTEEAFAKNRRVEVGVIQK